MLILILLCSSALAQYPGGRDEFGYFFKSPNQFFIFGGHGYGDANLMTSNLGDMWGFNGTSFTWIGGNSSVPKTFCHTPVVSTTPGSRQRHSIAFHDEQNAAYLFGGEIAGGLQNDLWKFDLSSGLWTFIKGVVDPAVWDVSSFTRQMEFDAANYPGSRYHARLAVAPSKDHLLLFGGYGYPNNSAVGNLNDLWAFRFCDQNWAFMRGDQVANSLATNQDSGFHPLNKPSGRFSHQFICSNSTSFCYLYGGVGYSITAFSGVLADLWVLDADCFQWKYVYGGQSVGHSVTYGQIGQVDPNSNLGSREGHLMFIDDQRHYLYIYGGRGSSIVYGDVFRLDLTNNQVAWMGGINSANNQPQPIRFSSRRNLGGWFDSILQVIFLFGGRTTDYRSDIWAMHVNHDTWQAIGGPDFSSGPLFGQMRPLYAPDAVVQCPAQNDLVKRKNVLIACPYLVKNCSGVVLTRASPSGTVATTTTASGDGGGAGQGSQTTTTTHPSAGTTTLQASQTTTQPESTSTPDVGSSLASKVIPGVSLVLAILVFFQ